MANTRTFTDDEVATALATLRANGGNAKRTAQALGIPRTTLRQWAGRAKSSTAHPKQVSTELVREHGEELAQSFEDFARKAMGTAPERIPEMSGKDLLVASAIAIEKMQLLRGQATNRTESAQIVYVQPSALRDLSVRVLDGQVIDLPTQRQLPAATPESLG